MSFFAQDGYRSGVLGFFHNIIAHIVTALQVGEVREKRLKVEALAADDIRKLVYRSKTGDRFKKSKKKAKDRFMSSGLQIGDASGISAIACLVLNCKTSCKVLNEIFRKRLDWICLNLRDGRDSCTVSVPITTWSGARRLTTGLDYI